MDMPEKTDVTGGYVSIVNQRFDTGLAEAVEKIFRRHRRKAIPLEEFRHELFALTASDPILVLAGRDGNITDEAYAKFREDTKSIHLYPLRNGMVYYNS